MRKTICLCISILLVLFAGVSCTQYQYWPIPMPSVEKYTITLVVGNGETEEHSVKEGSSYVLPDDFTMDGKTLVGWAVPNGVEYNIGDEVVVYSDMVFIGKWITEGKTATVGEVEYDTPYNALIATINNKEDGSVVEIYSDSEGKGIGIFNGTSPAAFTQGLTVDFNNHEYIMSSGPVGSPETESQTFHFERDNTVVFKDGIIKNESNASMLIQNYSNLTLDNIELVANDKIVYMLSINNGEVKLKNGTTLSMPATEGRYVCDLYYWPEGTYLDGCSMIVEDDSVVLSGNINISDDGTDSGNFPDKVNFVVPVGYIETQNVNIIATGYTISWVPSTYSGYTDGYEMMVLKKK